MNAVTVLLAYAATLSWLAPPVLARLLTHRTVRPRVAVAAWLVTVATTALAWIGALAMLTVGALHALITNSAVTFCVDTLGLTHVLVLPTSASTAIVVALLVPTAAITVRTGWRVGKTLNSTRRANREHAEAVHIVGHATDYVGVVAIGADTPTAYCVASRRRNTIVVSTAASAARDPAGFAAVLAHERAHLRGRHHLILAVLNAAHTALPRLPLLRAAATAVPVWLEMCADDQAVRHHGRQPLLSSLYLLSTGHPLPAHTLAAAGTAVLDRMLRLSRPPLSGPRHHDIVAAAWVACTIAAVPVAALTFCIL